MENGYDSSSGSECSARTTPATTPPTASHSEFGENDLTQLTRVLTVLLRATGSAATGLASSRESVSEVPPGNESLHPSLRTIDDGSLRVPPNSAKHSNPNSTPTTNGTVASTTGNRANTSSTTSTMVNGTSAHSTTHPSVSNAPTTQSSPLPQLNAMPIFYPVASNHH
ncbi:hypothetical protein BCR39DRAFT_560150 [Naematelia encephala]|uniref:Uncharacterized protein n=1 Tax=Naematelia encephala TaxID=71784 RepID=A0A1Y2AXJ1_9TREE|nr:hypothetical protein BCR39DRAFT_560150 [Naematelia encephala]